MRATVGFGVNANRITREAPSPPGAPEHIKRLGCMLGIAPERAHTLNEDVVLWNPFHLTFAIAGRSQRQRFKLRSRP